LLFAAEAYFNCLTEQALGQLFYFAAADRADADECFRPVPSMIEDVYATVAAGAFLRRNADQLVDGFFRQESVSAERNQVIQLLDTLLQQFMQESKHQRYRRSASAIGYDDQHSLAFEPRLSERSRH